MFELLTWQDWALAYFIVGVVVLLSTCVPLYLATRKAKPDTGGGFTAIFDAPIPADFLESVLAPLIGITLICSFWPYVIWLKIAQKWFTNPPIEEKPFSVSHDDLREHLSFEEIEAAERVSDPLGAVPDLPFGHLHGAWERLKGNPAPGDEVWTFSARWVNWSSKYLCSGYVIVNDGEIGAFWVTDRKSLDTDDDSKKDRF